ncbi:MAG: TonB-dependent receptor [Chryseolinea sp.]
MLSPTRRYLTLLFVIFASTSTPLAFSQSITQTVRGRIIDEDTRMPLPGANIVLIGNEKAGTTSDADGYFRLPNIPVGRISLALTFIGYENRVLQNILVTSGKETVLDVSLKESLMMMDAVEVKADKSEIANEMALTSARAFSVEETKRYAGSFNDPARMVSAYAGVDADVSGNNSIIVRGNSPRGIQWRLEGIDIPNPNHFADEGSTGGPINALNSQMLANSEFYTGAFAPEFGNALSGVFDMSLRKGNNEKREYSLSVGVLGTDVSAEGPFVKGGKASYLVNYRYSTLSILNDLGLVDFDGVPKYQDLSYKIYVPTKKMGTFSLFGLGGKSKITEEEFAEEDEEKLLQRGYYNADMGVTGITQYWPLSDKTYLQNSITLSTNGSGYDGFKPNATNELRQVDDFSMDKHSIKAASSINHKFNARHTVQAGFIFTQHSYNFYSNSYQTESDSWVTEQDSKGKADQYQGYVSWRFRPTNDISLVSGLHVQKVSLNSEISVEPRISARWQFHPTQAVTAGFGIHGKMESLPNYFAIVDDGNGGSNMPNTDLKMNKARHFVVGYENKLSQNLFLKIEGYYQQLYHLPVENNSSSSYSLINQVEGFTDRALVNKGTGHNIGMELTLERYFANDYYFLVSTSIFDSRYKALDGVERNTRFNSNVIGNVLVGKEFHLSSKNGKNKVLGINAKISSLGARRYTPIDEEQSALKNETVYFEDQAFSMKGDNVFLANIAVSYRIDNRRIGQELKLDIQNVTNNDAKLGYYYNDNTGKVESSNQLPLLPVLSYTIHF